MRRALIDLVHVLSRRQGVDIVRYQPTTHYLARRMQLLRSTGVDLVLDVGANDGEYATELRRIGYQGRMISFEPLPDAVERLRQRSADDDRWDVRPVALGDASGTTSLNVAGNSASSSLLTMRPEHERYAPGTGTVGVVEIVVERLDDIAADVLGEAARPFVKIDTQGFERRVLDGAAATISRVMGLQVELSIVPLYDEAPPMLEMLEYLDGLGFELMGLEPGFSDSQSGRLLQFDGVFYRPAVLEQ